MYYTDSMGLPNCILILTPHHPAQIWEGNDPEIKTPYLRALALHGTYFSNAYSPIPIGTTPIGDALQETLFDPMESSLNSKQYTSAIVGLEPSIQHLKDSFEYNIPVDPGTKDLIQSLGDRVVRQIQQLKAPFFLTLLLPEAEGNVQELPELRQSIEETDRQIGRILATLSARGHTNNIILYAGLAGEKSGEESEFLHFRDPALKVPLLVSGISGQQRNTTVDAPVSIAHIAPAFHNIIQQTSDAALLSLLKDPQAHQPRYVFLESNDGTKIVRTHHYKLIMQPNTSGGILYDLHHDSKETTNVYGKPSSLGEQLRLQQLIAEPTK